MGAEEGDEREAESRSPAESTEHFRGMHFAKNIYLCNLFTRHPERNNRVALRTG
jgi:hypothetical protein